MHSISVSQALVWGLLVTAPLAAGYAPEPAAQELSKRYVGGPAAFAAKMVRELLPNLEARHHTEAQIAAKKAKAAKHKAKTGARDVPEPDEFGSWTDKREPHHTEAQIAAKKAKAAKAKAKINARDVPEPDEFGPWDSDSDEFGSWVDKREAHHTEAQIAAKKAKAAKDKAKACARDVPEPDEFGSWTDKREAHHTEAQIAAKKAKAEAKAKACARDVPAADEFGPWDSDEDEFGSWVDKREAHHTEAQIAAKKAKAAKDKAAGDKAKACARDVPEPDEFGSWTDKREAHHTEAQIAAKKAKAEAKAKACAT